MFPTNFTVIANSNKRRLLDRERWRIEEMNDIRDGALAVNNDLGIRATVVDFVAGKRFPIKTSNSLVHDLLSGSKAKSESYRSPPLQYMGRKCSRWIHLPGT